MPSTLQAKVAFRKASFPPSFPFPSRFPRIYFPSFSPVNPAFFSLSKLFQTFSLTLSPLSPSLSSAMNPTFKKLLSFLASAFLYAVTSYAFFLIFFRSQF
jgi:hypothetical protein